ncbi:MAG: PQQ-binding-like beta-propeller repeat protein [Planctomycetes bacterium]|nr:PQQ-binding-like beta-propeller repeat protein [Planctomycetota bacterium]
MFTHGDQLFLINNLGKLYALNAKNGTINWTRSLSSTPVTVSPVTYFDNSVLLLFGNTCFQVLLNNGNVAHETTFNFDVTTSVARWEDRLFVGANNNRFYSIRFADRVAMWQSVCPSPPLGSVTIDEDRVYFVARDNVLYVSDTKERNLLWKAPTVDLLTGVVIDKNQCFLPSHDTALYCLESQTGDLLWKHLAGGRLMQLPIVTDQFVYQPIEHDALICLNRLDGSLLWQLKGGKSYLTQNGPTTYVITHDQKLTLMDQRSAKRIASFYLRNFTLYAPSLQNPTLFLATPGGNILALRPNRIIAPPPATPSTPQPALSANSNSL